MSSERLPEGSHDPKTGPALPSPEVALGNIFERRKKLLELAEEKNQIQKRFEGDKLKLVAHSWYDNYFAALELKARYRPTNSNNIHFGYYNPATGLFVLDPDLVHPNEAYELLWELDGLRAKAIHDFDASGMVNETRTDYDHPDIKRLHQHLNDGLAVTGLLPRILETYNSQRLAEQNNPKYLTADEHTHAFVGLSNTDHRDLFIILYDACKDSNGVLLRESVTPIKVAKRGKDPVNPNEYQPASDLIISKKDMAVLNGMARLVEAMQLDLAVDGLDFDTAALGIVRRPPPKAADPLENLGSFDY